MSRHRISTPQSTSGPPPSSKNDDPAAWRRWLFAGSRANIHTKLRYFKQEASFNAQRPIVEQLGLRPFGVDLTGNLFPESYDQLQKDPPPSPNNADWSIHLLWNTHLFVENAKEITQFLRLRSLFGTSFVLGNYTFARSILNDIKTSMGVSLWSLEKEFLLKQYANGFTENKAFLSEIHGRDCDAYITYLSTLFSLRVEQSNLPEYFRRVLRNKVFSDYPDPNNKVREYICSYADPCSHLEIHHKSFCLWRDQAGNLVDRYIQTLKILRRVVASSEAQKYKPRILPLLSMLAEHISDPSINCIKSGFESEPTAKLSEEESNPLNSALDAFTAGDYSRSISISLIQISKTPLIFDFYEVAARSIVHSQQDLPPLTKGPSLAKTLLALLTTMLSERDSNKKAELELATIAQHLGENNLAFGIMECLNSRQPESNDFSRSRLAKAPIYKTPKAINHS